MRQLDANHPYHKVSGGSYEYFQGMGMQDLISKVEKVDDNTVRFTLTVQKRHSWLTWAWTSLPSCLQNMPTR
ncbi:Dipeptide-binding protein [Serratia fonticola]|uniref:Dipeptide-binding protein n=1 Tax=Serratia fonticola TaxID=47917 RepID=A0A4U9VUF6_SERFO|nr:Dipeptide-binding protein [Serratia fonticola]